MEEIKSLIKNSGIDEKELFSMLGESSESFWQKFNNDMDFTSMQMLIMEKVLNIQNPINFFYG